MAHLEKPSTCCKSKALPVPQKDGHVAPVGRSDEKLQAPPKTFYKRPLPEDHIAFSSGPGREMFAQAISGCYMRSYFTLAEQFQTQSDPAFCGLGTLAMVLNALAVDPSRVWKGVWRWYSEDLFDCCMALDHIQRHGITMKEFACIARCNGGAVQIYPWEATSLDLFRAKVKHAAASTSHHLVVAFSRKALNQTGDGHYSPIGGYHEPSDHVLVLDVARFKYPPWWIPLSKLYASMQPKDPATNKPRGFFVISADASIQSSLVRVNVTRPQWAAMASELAPLGEGWGGLEEFLRALVAVVQKLKPLSFSPAESPEEVAALEEIKALANCTAVAKALPRADLACDDVAAAVLFLLAIDEKKLPQCDAQREFVALRAAERLASTLEAEVGNVEKKLAVLSHFCCCGDGCGCAADCMCKLPG